MIRQREAIYARTQKCLLIFCVLCTQRLLAETGWQSLGDFVRAEEKGNQVELIAQRGRVRVTAVAPGVVRVTYGPGGTIPPDRSFAVLPDAFPAETKFKVLRSDGGVELRTDLVVVRVDKSPLRLTFLDTAGKILSQERADHPAAFNGTEFRVSNTMPDDEHYFGLGDKTGPLDHREIAFTNWNTDMFGWQESTDPLYKTIPFFLAMRKGAAYGIISRQHLSQQFDFGKEVARPVFLRRRWRRAGLLLLLRARRPST